MAREIRRLSARAVETLKPGLHADGDGLYLRVDTSGARRWAFIYHALGKRREMGLGRIGLKEAREAAEETTADPLGAGPYRVPSHGSRHPRRRPHFWGDQPRGDRRGPATLD